VGCGAFACLGHSLIIYVTTSFFILYAGWQHYLSKESVVALVQNKGEAIVFKQFLSDDKVYNRSARMLNLATVYQFFRMPLHLDFIET